MGYMLLKDGKGQTVFEYLLLVGGAVLIAVLAVHTLISGLQGGAEEVTDAVREAVSGMKDAVNEYLQKYVLRFRALRLSHLL